MAKVRFVKTVHNNEYAKIIGGLIAARKAAGLTQHEAAARLSKPQSFVSKLERGDRRLDVLEFLYLCRLYGVDPSEVLADKTASDRSGNS